MSSFLNNNQSKKEAHEKEANLENIQKWSIKHQFQGLQLKVYKDSGFQYCSRKVEAKSWKLEALFQFLSGTQKTGRKNMEI